MKNFKGVFLCLTCICDHISSIMFFEALNNEVSIIVLEPLIHLSQDKKTGGFSI